MSRQNITGRIKRFIDLAYRVAQTSDYDDYRHGAVLTRGNKVISVSANKNSHARFGKPFRKRNCGHATHNAEIGCILGLDRSVTRGSTVYVARVGKLGNMKISKPCEMCEEVLRHVGVRKVVYTINDKEVGVYKL